MDKGQTSEAGQLVQLEELHSEAITFLCSGIDALEALTELGEAADSVALDGRQVAALAGCIRLKIKEALNTVDEAWRMPSKIAESVNFRIAELEECALNSQVSQNAEGKIEIVERTRGILILANRCADHAFRGGVQTAEHPIGIVAETANILLASLREKAKEIQSNKQEEAMAA
jgi:hypothetical protein